MHKKMIIYTQAQKLQFIQKLSQLLKFVENNKKNRERRERERECVCFMSSDRSRVSLLS